MSDNTTSAKALDYDAHIGTVNPCYHRFHEDAIDVVRSACPSPAEWLDTGCGTGTLALKAAGLFPETEFTLADPSQAMLDVAAVKCHGQRVRFLRKGTLELDMPNDTFDIITAVLSHHYMDARTRRAATENCFRMLKRGGVYITFEHVRPFSDAGFRIGMERWRRYQLAQGRDPDGIAKHLSRFDTEYFPITVLQHLDVLRDSGFAVAELLYAGMMQAGFYAVK